MSEAFRAQAVRVEDGPFAAGEVSFHAASCFHTAGANRTTAARMVLATTYFADGTRVVPSPTMVSGDWRKFIPGAEPGQVVSSPLNPLWMPRSPLRARQSSFSTSVIRVVLMPRARLIATVTPEQHDAEDHQRDGQDVLLQRSTGQRQHQIERRDEADDGQPGRRREVARPSA